MIKIIRILCAVIVFLTVAGAVPTVSATQEDSVSIKPVDGVSIQPVDGVSIEPVDVAPSVSGGIYVNGVCLPDATPYIRGYEGNVMVPLRAVAEALNMTVDWKAEDERVIIDGDVEIWIGKTKYVISDSFTGDFGPPPELTDGKTYVSLPFYSYILNGYSAVTDGGCIRIDDLPYYAYREFDNVSYASFNQKKDGETVCLSEKSDDITVGIDGSGGIIYSFVRLPLGADLTADEISSAQLRLKLRDGDVPSYFYACFINENWTGALTPPESAPLMINSESAVPVAVTFEDGWASIDITGYVKSWMSGERQNNGIALLPDGKYAVSVYSGSDAGAVSYYTSNDAGSVSFYSGNDGAVLSPYITIEGMPGKRASGYGVFSFEGKTPADGLLYHANTEGAGNCLAYALRDTNPILMEQLGFDYADISEEYGDGGRDAVLEFVAGRLETYVGKNGKTLKISGFRRVAGYDAPIGPDEYRIALRIGIYPSDDGFDNHTFDYHFRVQSDDGRWSQKFPWDYSEIIPGSAGGVDPARFGWDSSRKWNNARFQNFYSGDIIYFAVKKDSAEFTRHRGIE